MSWLDGNDVPTRSESQPRQRRAVSFARSAYDLPAHSSKAAQKAPSSRKNQFAALADSIRQDGGVHQARIAQTRRTLEEHRSTSVPRNITVIAGAGRNSRLPHVQD